MSVDYAELLRLAKKGREAETRGKAIGGCIGTLITTVIVTLAHGCYLMLAVGIVHDQWIPGLPTIGYWWAVLLVALLRGVLSPIKSTKEKS